MTREEIEKMFLELNSVLVKFWKEQGRPDKEIKIELLERMLHWYKEMGYATLDKQEPSLPSDAEKAAEKYTSENYYELLAPGDLANAFLAGAEWQASRMPMPEDTVLFNKGVQEGRRLEREEKNGCKERTSSFILSESFNWDTFRAEAAKDIFCALMESGVVDTWRIMSMKAIGAADELIKQLRNNEKD